MPAWVSTGFQEYAKRLPRECRIELIEIAPASRGKNTAAERAMEAEADRLLAAVPGGGRIVALDERGDAWTTHHLSQQLAGWLQEGCDVSLLVGGPDGLAPRVKQQAHNLWSLSSLTLPHPLVRVVVAEQIYRAWSILQGHPYHRD